MLGLAVEVLVVVGGTHQGLVVLGLAVEVLGVVSGTHQGLVVVDASSGGDAVVGLVEGFNQKLSDGLRTDWGNNQGQLAGTTETGTGNG